MNKAADIQTALANFANAQFQLGVATAQLEALLKPLIENQQTTPLEVGEGQ